MPRAQGAIEQVIRQRVEQHPGDVWLKWKDETVSWRDVLSNVQRVANGLLELGVRPGERVAILMNNRPEYLWTHLAVQFIGALSVPVNISQRGVALRHILADSDAAAVVVQDDVRDALAAIRSGCPALRHAVVVGGKPGSDVDCDFGRLLDAPDREPEIDLEAATGGIGMMYTSGTTGPPKGVVTVEADTAPLLMLLEASGVRPGETMYSPLPLFHGNALHVSALGSMMLDAKFALGERFSASRFFDDCRKYEATEFNTLGGMISILLKQPPRSDDFDNPVRTVLSAGCPPQHWEEFEQRFGVHIVEWYGMVDAPGYLLNQDGRVGSMGKPIAGAAFEVVDDDDQPVGSGTVGELVFQHPKGRLTYYHKLPEATDAAYRGGWFHSGDLAERDDDGFYYYRGRKKESMRRLGENISAWEIETVLNEHPKVLESAAHAVKSALGEDDVKVTVVLQPGVTATAEELLDFCGGRMAYYAVPRYVEFVEAIPKTDTQRVQYGVLKDRGVTPDTWDREDAGYRVART